MTTSDLVAAVSCVATALGDLQVPFYITGSLASSIHGVPRTSADVDVVADLRPEHVDALATRLESDYYLDRDRIQAAIQHRRSFNLIHLRTMLKVDVFPSKGRPFDEAVFRRVVSRRLDETDSPPIPIASAEDAVLAKLEWFKAGGESSERQWMDIVGVLKVQERRLDLAYLRSTARGLSVATLLERAIAEAAPPV